MARSKSATSVFQQRDIANKLFNDHTFRFPKLCYLLLRQIVRVNNVFGPQKVMALGYTLRNCKNAFLRNHRQSNILLFQVHLAIFTFSILGKILFFFLRFWLALQGWLFPFDLCGVLPEPVVPFYTTSLIRLS
jgi:hypothetical protein